MIKIGIHEPDYHVRLLLEAQIRALGHEPLLLDEQTAALVRDEVDAVLVETASKAGLEFARRLRAERREIALIVVSISEPAAETRALDAVAHLTKPFKLVELERVLRDVPATAPRERRRARPLLEAPPRAR